jgi:hypothetical protein
VPGLCDVGVERSAPLLGAQIHDRATVVGHSQLLRPGGQRQATTLPVRSKIGSTLTVAPSTARCSIAVAAGTWRSWRAAAVICSAMTAAIWAGRPVLPVYFANAVLPVPLASPVAPEPPPAPTPAAPTENWSQLSWSEFVLEPRTVAIPPGVGIAEARRASGLWRGRAYCARSVSAAVIES